MLYIIFLFITLISSQKSILELFFDFPEKLSKNQCECYYQDTPYNCGTIHHSEICWDGNWLSCRWNSYYDCYHCKCENCTLCPVSPKIVNYKVTFDGTIYSNFVQTVMPKDHNLFVNGPILHSSKITVGSYVRWPNDLMRTSVLQVDYHNVTTDRDNCCFATHLGPNAECRRRFCCGEECCC